MNAIFYLHIPKTGGQTLASRMASAFEPARVHYLQNDFRFPQDNELFASLVRSRDFIGSHISGPIPAHISKIDILTTIREPISRLLSTYRHIRREPRDRLHRAATALSPTDFFRNYGDVFANYQARALVHASYQHDRVNHVKNAYAQWIYNRLPDAIGRIKWLVPTEAIDDFTSFWSAENGIHLPQTDIVNNVAPPDNVSNTTVRQVIERYPELYALDLELWNQAKHWMQNYKKQLLLGNIERRTPNMLAFQQADDAIWLVDGWLSPLATSPGVIEWWAGPNRTSAIAYRCSTAKAILFDIPVMIGITPRDISAYSGSDFRQLACRPIIEQLNCPTLRIDMTGMPPEGTILLNVPEVFSSAQFSSTDPDTTRRSFSSAGWRFDGVSTPNVKTVNAVGPEVVADSGRAGTSPDARRLLSMSSENSCLCKLCGQRAELQFGLPRNKKAGHPIPDEPDDCWYYQCSRCNFLFTDGIDAEDHGKLYDETYWDKQDPDWYGRVTETFRLVFLANELLHKRGQDLDVLDFGCGMGTFVESGRRSLGMQVWGTDIITPKFGVEWYLADLGDQKFDVITACEVIEHLPQPRKIFDHIRAHLKSPGVFAFQTAQWDPTSLGRDWWYLGPHNGHISLYSREGLDHVYRSMNASGRRMWNNYPGIQAWMFD